MNDMTRVQVNGFFSAVVDVPTAMFSDAEVHSLYEYIDEVALPEALMDGGSIQMKADDFYEV